jgi:hypothetical protein
MKGWVMVEQSGFKSDKKLKEWIEMAKKFVRKLPRACKLFYVNS